MNNSSNQNNSEQNDRLAEFTDEVLAGKVEQSDPRSDDELRSLEETILRLKHAVPQIELDEATVNHMQARLNARLQHENRRTNLSLWQKWFRARRSHPQMIFAFGALLILVFAIFIAPLLTRTGPSTTAVANRPSPFVLIVATLAGVGLLIIWINHRK